MDEWLLRQRVVRWLVVVGVLAASALCGLRLPCGVGCTWYLERIR